MESNPCLKLGIPFEQSKKKPAITLAEHRKIVYELRQLRARDPGKGWMLTAYRIGYWQGFRLSETCFPLAAVDLARNVIGIKTKGKKGANVALAEFPLSPKLRPLLLRLKSQALSRVSPAYSLAALLRTFAAFLFRLDFRTFVFIVVGLLPLRACITLGFPASIACA